MNQIQEIDIPASILVVDDDPGIRTLIADSLGAHGFTVLTAPDTREMDRVLAAQRVDLVILDVMMPGEDGLSACRRLATSDGPPIIMLSAMDDRTDRIVGLELGADHYLGKPCDPRELLAHVRATLRRTSGGRIETPAPSASRVAFLDWTVDLLSRELIDKQGVLVHLSNGEFALLRAFLERPRRVLTREQLLDAARGPETDSYDRAVDVQVSRVRRKLRAGDSDLIRTVRNEGYMFVPQVRRL